MASRVNKDIVTFHITVDPVLLVNVVESLQDLVTYECDLLLRDAPGALRNELVKAALHHFYDHSQGINGFKGLEVVQNVDVATIKCQCDLIND